MTTPQGELIPKRIDIEKTSVNLTVASQPHGTHNPVMWRVRVAETGRIFEVPVFEKTGYHEVMNILLVLPGVPSASHDTLYLVGPPPYRLLTSKKFSAIVHSGEPGQVFVYNISENRIPLSPVSEPADRSNKSIERIITTCVSIIERARQNLIQQEIQASAINTLLIYVENSLDSFYKSYFAPVEEKLTSYMSEISEFDDLMSQLAETPLHPAIVSLHTQKIRESVLGGASRGSLGSDLSNTSSPSGSRTATPRGGGEGDPAPISEAPSGNTGISSPRGNASSAPAEVIKNPHLTLLDCINVEYWKSKKTVFSSSCDEIRVKLNSLLNQYNTVRNLIEKPFVLRNVYMNLMSLHRITALLRSIIKQPSPSALSSSGIVYAEPSPMAMKGPVLTAEMALREILRHGEPKISADVTLGESLDSPASASAAVVVQDMLFTTSPASTSSGSTASVGTGSVDVDPRDIIAIYVHMEKTLQQQLLYLDNVGMFDGNVERGCIYLKDLSRGSTISDANENPTDSQPSAATVAEALQRRRLQMDQMAKVMDYVKDRIADEVCRIGRLVRDLKVALKQIEKSDDLKFLKLWMTGKNEHSATLKFLQNYPAAYQHYLSEVSRIRNFNENIKLKVEDFRRYQNDEFVLRKQFWESSLRYLPPFFLEIVPSVRRPPPMLLGPGGIPALDELFSGIPDLTVSDPAGSLNINYSGGSNVSASAVKRDEVDRVNEEEENGNECKDDSESSNTNKISELENRLREKEKEIEELKLALKGTARYENDLRNLQSIMNPFDLERLKAHLASRELASRSALSTDLPMVEDLCEKVIVELELDERERLTELQKLLSSNVYYRDSCVEKGNPDDGDINVLRMQHLESLEHTMEQFAKIIQHQDRFIKSDLLQMQEQKNFK